MTSKNKELLKLLKTNPKLGNIVYDSDLILNISVNTPTTQKTPVIIILCGPSGSGKSTIKSSLLQENKVTNYVNIDPDEIRSVLVEKGLRLESEDPKLMAKITNKFNLRMFLYAVSKKLNIVFDTTGRNMHAMNEVLKLTGEYFKIFAAVHTTWENCKKRIIYRNLKTKGIRKELPLTIAKEIYDGFLKGTLSNYLIKYPIQKKVNEIKLFDNNVPKGSVSKLVYYLKDDKVIYSENYQGFYNLNITDSKVELSDETAGDIKNKNKNKSKKKKKRTRKIKKKSRKKKKKSTKN